jgi:murein DD-endopeptidase MepM/ murein hydrolase activator NlpD
MSRVLELLCSRRVPQVAALALVSIGFSGCSADMSTRFQQDPLSNPFASRSDATGSVAAPTPQVQRRELPQYARPQSQYSSSALPPPVSAPQSYPVSSGVSGGGRGIASYSPPPRPRMEATGTVASRSVAARKPEHNSRGTTIIVGTADTLETIARHYHVSTAEILRANGYRGPRALQPGQQLIIPRRAEVARETPAAASRVAAAPAAAGGVHYVNRGETLMSIARHNHVSLSELARANHLAPGARLNIGDKIVVPGRGSAVATAGPGTPPHALGTPAPQPAAAKVAEAEAAPAAPSHVPAAPAEPVQKARLATATDTPAAAAAATPHPVKAAEATGALPTFRWPVRGRIITAYGAKTNGKVNDGINVAVPEGTPVKAAEDGVVAYAGNELKGYGNLILIRHANGYVTAYAHASQLLVKRGESIKRGQVIAKSGQTGEVGSPQLHFEIRKGSSPVDPMQFLNGA